MNLVSALLQQGLKLAISAVALLPALVVSADIQKWVDHEGRVHYADQAPPWAGAKPIEVQPNVIETDPVSRPESTVKRPTSRTRAERSPEPSHRQRAEIRFYTELCRANRGIDCEREARAMIDGPATVLFPGDPLIFPRPDLKPASPRPQPRAPERL